MSPKSSAKPSRAKRPGVSAAQRAGLVVAPSRARKIIIEGRHGDKRRVSGHAAVYLAGLIEALGAYILKDAAAVCLDRKRKCVTAKHIGHALHTDALLRKTHLGQALITGQWQQPELRRVQLVARKAQV